MLQIQLWGWPPSPQSVISSPSAPYSRASSAQVRILKVATSILPDRLQWVFTDGQT